MLLTDLQPQQQAAAIVMRLQGGAREFARMITPQELMNGGLHNGVMVDPVTYVIAGLHARFSPLEEESRLSAMTEMMAFTRKPGESINAVLSRYEVVRQRAALEGQFTMPITGCALQLFRAIGMGPQQMMTILQPIGGQLPTNDAEFANVCQSLRRYGHIQENHPNNIGQSLQGPFRQARPGQYFAESDPQPGESSASHTYYGETQAGATSSTPLIYDQSIQRRYGTLETRVLTAPKCPGTEEARMPTPMPWRMQSILKATCLHRRPRPTTKTRTLTWTTSTACPMPTPQKPFTCSTEWPRESGAASQGAQSAVSDAVSRSSCVKERAKVKAIGKAKEKASCTPKKTCRRSSQKVEEKEDPVHLERATDAERIRQVKTAPSCVAEFVTAMNIFNENVPTTPAVRAKVGKAPRSCLSLPSLPPEARAPTVVAQAFARRGATMTTMTSLCIPTRFS